MSVARALLESGMVEPHGNSVFSKENRRKPVVSSKEFERILAIPRRTWKVTEAGVIIRHQDGTEKAVPDFTNQLRRPGSLETIWPLQNWALYEIAKAGGGFLPIPVGGGKTLVSLLACYMLKAKRTLLIVKPQLKIQLMTIDIPFYNKHFKLPLDGRLKIIAYTDLSGEKNADILERYKPDAIIADEAHSFRHASANRTWRFNEYMNKRASEGFPVAFVALSGTMTKRSLRDYQHLSKYALRGNSPLPNSFFELEEWCEALDVPQGDEPPKPPGVLLQFCKFEGQPVREAFRDRLIETMGVVTSAESSIEIPINIRRRIIDVPQAVKDKIAEVYETWMIGEEDLADGMAITRVVRQIATGFYYQWKWPNGIRDAEWIQARRRWMRALRGFLERLRRPGLDSPFLVENATREKRIKSASPVVAELYEAYPLWAEIRGRTKPETVPKWVDPFLVRDAINWGKERIARGENGLIFYDNVALGHAISKVSGWGLYGADANASATHPKKEPVIVCSIAAQGTGKNLQAWNRMLVCSPMANGVAWQQLIGRCARPGQKASSVEIDVYLHSRAFSSALSKAVADAHYMKATQGLEQLLLTSNLIDISLDREDPNEDLMDEDEEEAA
jgi:hypothetical protein